jgi:hypothetical protein
MNCCQRLFCCQKYPHVVLENVIDDEDTETVYVSEEHLEVDESTKKISNLQKEKRLNAPCILCVQNQTYFFFTFLFCSEIEQTLSILISDRATDEVLEELTRCSRGIGISESPSNQLDDPLTPDIVRSRSSHVSIVWI